MTRGPLLPLVLLAACAGARRGPPTAEDPTCLAPLGSPEQLTVVAGTVDRYGFPITVAPIERCGTSASVALVGGGHRRFVLPPDEATCHGRPDPADPCDTLSPDRFGEDVRQLLEAQGIPLIGDGMGPCGELGAWEDWDYGVSVQSWAQADAAIEVVSDRMRAWRIGHSFRVSVRPLSCGWEL